MLLRVFVYARIAGVHLLYQSSVAAFTTSFILRMVSISCSSLRGSSIMCSVCTSLILPHMVTKTLVSRPSSHSAFYVFQGPVADPHFLLHAQILWSESRPKMQSLASETANVFRSHGSSPWEQVKSWNRLRNQSWRLRNRSWRLRNRSWRLRNRSWRTRAGVWGTGAGGWGPICGT